LALFFHYVQQLELEPLYITDTNNNVQWLTCICKPNPIHVTLVWAPVKCNNVSKDYLLVEMCGAEVQQRCTQSQFLLPLMLICENLLQKPSGTSWNYLMDM
jgi:hypothetical protein